MYSSAPTPSGGTLSGFAKAYYDLGIVYLSMRQKDNALDTYRKLEAVDKIDAEQLHSRILLERRARRPARQEEQTKAR